MIYTSYDLLFLFFIYSFLGWCLEVIYAAAGRSEFVNRGLLNGMLCPVYGVSAVFMVIFMEPLREEWFYLFLGCLIVGTVTELLTGLILEKAFHLKLWDYSGRKFQAGGYICLATALVWGAMGILTIKFINPALVTVLESVPYLPGLAALVLLCLILAVDMVMTAGALLHIKNQNQAMSEIAEGLNQVSRSLETAITGMVNRRMNRAFPSLEKKTAETEEERQELIRQKEIFAYGCSFHMVVWIFFLGAFLGDLTETVFCRAAMGRWMSRSSVVYGSFSLVWGIGVAGATILLYRYRNREDRYIFAAGTLLGGAYEYICSVFTEILFGKVFWDYSAMPLNLNGRICFTYSVFWGLLGILWIKDLYPRMAKWILKIPNKVGRPLTWALTGFMVFNIIVSCVTVYRWAQRREGVPPASAFWETIDERFPNQRMERIFANMYFG